MDIPQIKYNTENKPYVDGNFLFKISTIYDEKTFTPIKSITFKWCPIIEQIQGGVSDEEIMELFFDKFKKDFIREINK